MKTTVVYIHGWGSGPEGDTATQLKHVFADESFVCPQFDFSEDPSVLKQKFDQLGKKLMGHGDVVVVGSSAGGFWADYMGSVYGLKTVLINPSLRPSVNFKKYGLSKQALEQYAKLEQHTSSHTRYHMTAFMGDKDDVVPSAHIKTKYKNPIVLAGEGHRVSDLKPVIKLIKGLVGNYPEPHE